MVYGVRNYAYHVGMDQVFEDAARAEMRWETTLTAIILNSTKSDVTELAEGLRLWPGSREQVKKLADKFTNPQVLIDAHQELLDAGERLMSHLLRKRD